MSNAEGRYGYFIVGYFDLLGQSRKLRDLPKAPTDARERKRTIDRLIDRAEEVRAVRRLFRDFFDTRFYPESLDPAMRSVFDRIMTPELVHWGFSDTYVVAALAVSQDKFAAGVFGLRQTLLAAAMMWLHCLINGHPIRGGIELGLGIKIGPTEVFGPALLEAYHLESKVAQSPRIMVGPECLKLLSIIEDQQNRTPNPDSRLASVFAHSCRRMLLELPMLSESSEQQSKQTMVHALSDALLQLSPELQEMVPKAHENVRAQLRNARNSDNEKLVGRYESLLEYFNEHAPTSARRAQNPGSPQDQKDGRTG